MSNRDRKNLAKRKKATESIEEDSYDALISLVSEVNKIYYYDLNKYLIIYLFNLIFIEI